MKKEHLNNMVTIIDYGVGNINAFLNIFKQLNIQAKTASTVDQLEGATKLILPGVGHFDYAMQRDRKSTRLNSSHWE